MKGKPFEPPLGIMPVFEPTSARGPFFPRWVVDFVVAPIVVVAFLAALYLAALIAWGMLP